MLLISGIAGTAYGRNELENISPRRSVIKQYEPFELDVSVNVPYGNPYDAEQIDLSARIVTPEGGIVTIPAFYVGKMSPWKIRYTPVSLGEFSYSLSLKTPSTKYYSYAYTFKVIPGRREGFLRKSENNPFYLVFDSGKPFFGLGHNVAWVADNNIPVYKKYFSSLKNHGGNMTRVWINNPWTLSIENKKIGQYNLPDCRKLDSLIKLAEEYRIYVILVLDSYGSLLEEGGYWNEEVWNVNPYNEKNGGPCKTPLAFFTNPEAKRHYKNRLRYIISRWSHSPNILAFELWNETDTPRDWTTEMASYLKSINPHGQLVTTSLGYPWDNNFNESSVWTVKDVDIVEQHVYGGQSKDIIGYLVSINRELMKKYNKPIFTGEFGMDMHKNDKFCDEAGLGVALHNSIWAAALSGSFSGTLNWWWAGYVGRKNLYPHYRALRNFLQDVNWDSKHVAFAKTTPITQRVIGEEISYSDITVRAKKTWGDTRYKEFIINNNGDVSGGVVNYYLHGLTKTDLKINPVFHLNYPEDGKFIIHVDMVSQGGKLTASLDNNEILSKEFPTGPDEGPWKKSTYLKDYDIYQCRYDTSVELDIPKGEHTLRLSNAGEDWIGIKEITLTNYKSNAFANARVTGMAVDKEILIWIQNKDFNWRSMTKDIEPSTITDASFTIQDIKNGAYEMEWWDTFKGDIIFREGAYVENNMMLISIPYFSKDLACKIRKR